MKEAVYSFGSRHKLFVPWLASMISTLSGTRLALRVLALPQSASQESRSIGKKS